MISSASLLFSSHLSWSWLLALSFFRARRGAYRPQEGSLPPPEGEPTAPQSTVWFYVLSFRRISHPIFTLPLSNSSSLSSAPPPAPVRDEGRRETGSGIPSLQTTSSTLKRMNGNHTARKSLPPPHQKGKERRKKNLARDWGGLDWRGERKGLLELR